MFLVELGDGYGDYPDDLGQEYPEGRPWKLFQLPLEESPQLRVPFHLNLSPKHTRPKK